jgi:hypothetical protein
MREWLARFRVTIGFLTAVAVFWLASPTPALLLAGVSIAIAGEAVRVWATGHLNKSHEVTSSGPYRWVAHPLYLGSSIIGVGLAVACGSVPAAVLIVVYLVVTLGAAIRTEEAFLRERFGERYESYRRGADRAREGDSGARRFSVARVIANREHRTIAGLGLAVLLLVLKATYNGLFWRSAAGR